MHTSITIAGLELHGFHGYFEEEQQLGQKFLFDVITTLAPVATHSADDFETSVRYDQLIEAIAYISNKSKFRTLEALSEAIARELLMRFNRIHNISVTVSKATPPIPQSVDHVLVKVQLDRFETLDAAK